jgi:hypothetical protein
MTALDALLGQDDTVIAGLDRDRLHHPAAPGRPVAWVDIDVP